MLKCLLATHPPADMNINWASHTSNLFDTHAYYGAIKFNINTGSLTVRAC